MDKGIPTSDGMWIQAIQLRVEDMLKTHPEIDEESLALLVETLGAGLRTSNKLLQAFQSGCSFIESDFYDADKEFNTKTGSAKRTATRISKNLSNGAKYSISGPYFNSKRRKINGKS
jgi:hypothetical protein